MKSISKVQDTNAQEYRIQDDRLNPFLNSQNEFTVEKDWFEENPSSIKYIQNRTHYPLTNQFELIDPEWDGNFDSVKAPKKKQVFRDGYNYYKWYNALIQDSSYRSMGLTLEELTSIYGETALSPNDDLPAAPHILVESTDTKTEEWEEVIVPSQYLNNSILNVPEIHKGYFKITNGQIDFYWYMVFQDGHIIRKEMLDIHPIVIDEEGYLAQDINGHNSYFYYNIEENKIYFFHTDKQYYIRDHYPFNINDFKVYLIGEEVNQEPWDGWDNNIYYKISNESETYYYLTIKDFIVKREVEKDYSEDDFFYKLSKYPCLNAKIFSEYSSYNKGDIVYIDEQQDYYYQWESNYVDNLYIINSEDLPVGAEIYQIDSLPATLTLDYKNKYLQIGDNTDYYILNTTYGYTLINNPTQQQKDAAYDDVDTIPINVISISDNYKYYSYINNKWVLETDTIDQNKTVIIVDDFPYSNIDTTAYYVKPIKEYLKISKIVRRYYKAERFITPGEFQIINDSLVNWSEYNAYTLDIDKVLLMSKDLNEPILLQDIAKSFSPYREQIAWVEGENAISTTYTWKSYYIWVATGENTGYYAPLPLDQINTTIASESVFIGQIPDYHVQLRENYIDYLSTTNSLTFIQVYSNNFTYYTHGASIELEQGLYAMSNSYEIEQGAYYPVKYAEVIELPYKYLPKELKDKIEQLENYTDNSTIKFYENIYLGTQYEDENKKVLTQEEIKTLIETEVDTSDCVKYYNNQVEINTPVYLNNKICKKVNNQYYELIDEYNLDTALSALSDSLSSDIASVSGQLSNYCQTNEVYTKGWVDTKFSDYYTRSEINTKFGSYYDSSTIDGKLDYYYTTSQVNGFVDSLQDAINDLNISYVDLLRRIVILEAQVAPLLTTGYIYPTTVEFEEEQEQG